MSTDCSCQVEGKLWLIEGAVSTEQKNLIFCSQIDTFNMEAWD